MRMSSRKAVTAAAAVIVPVLALFLGAALADAGEGGSPASRPQEGIRELGSRRELFVDHFLIERLQGAALAMANPREEEVALRFDRPWEGAFCGYCTIIRDGSTCRLYYRGLPKADTQEVTCYAQSPDGIRWTRPNLGLFEVAGTRENNVILAGQPPFSHNFCPFLDTRPGVQPAERYKALAGLSHSGLSAFVSADGIRWTRLGEGPVLKDAGWVFDSQNVPFWSQAEQRYVVYYRKAARNVRAIARSTSADFRQWSAPEMMTYSDTGSDVPSHHLYTNQTAPYFRGEHLYVSIAARFMPGRQAITTQQAQEIGVDKRYFKDLSDGVLMTSRGGTRYDRTFLEAFLRPGIGPENWVSRTNYPALNLIQTGPAEMSLYVQHNYGQPTAYLRRCSLRLDGLASVRAPLAGGQMVTRPLTFTGGRLLLNYATSAAGSIRVEVQGPDGKPLPGFTLAQCRELVGNQIEQAVEWTGGQDLGRLAGQPVRLCIVLKDADLYALQFAP